MEWTKEWKKIIYYITRWSWKIRRPCCQYNVIPCRNGGMDGQRKWEFQTHKMWNHPHLMWSKAIEKMMRPFFHFGCSIGVRSCIFISVWYVCSICVVSVRYIFLLLFRITPSKNWVKKKRAILVESSGVEPVCQSNLHACGDVELRAQSNICASWFKKVATSFV